MSDLCVVQTPFVKESVKGSKNSLFSHGTGVLNTYLNEQNISFRLINLNIFFKKSIYGPGYNLEKVFSKENCLSYLTDKNIFLEQFLSKIVEKNGLNGYSTYFFSVSSSYNLLTVYCLAKYLKEKNKDITIVLGGPYLSKKGNENHFKALELPYIDFIFNGDIEGVDLPKDLSSDNLKEVEGFCYSYEDEIIIKNRVEVSIEEESVPTYPKYFVDEARKSSLKNDFIPIYRLSKNCPNNCVFCNFELGCSYKSLEKVYEDIKFLKEEYSTDKIYFADANLMSNPDYLFELSQKLGELNIYWGGMTGFIDVDENYVSTLKQNGCKFLATGLESGSTKILRDMRKPVKKETMSDFISKLTENGIKSYNHLIAGFPTEDYTSLNETKKFLRDNFKHIFDISINIFSLFKDTEVYRNPEKFGIVIEEENVEKSKEAILKSANVSIPYRLKGKTVKETNIIKKKMYNSLFYRFKPIAMINKSNSFNLKESFEYFLKKPRLRFKNELTELYY